LAVQIAAEILVNSNFKVLYVNKEESIPQLVERIERLEITQSDKLISCQNPISTY
jgi:predicted ATP-dependent serine protease